MIIYYLSIVLITYLFIYLFLFNYLFIIFNIKHVAKNQAPLTL